MAFPITPSQQLSVTRGLISLQENLPPGRPGQTAERMPVPGRPQAEEQRPTQSPGRIPIADVDTEFVDAQVEMVEAIDGRVKSSLEYQLLKAMQSDHSPQTQADEHNGQETKTQPLGASNQAYQELHTERQVTIEIQTEITAHLELSVEFRRSISTTKNQEPPPQSDPLVLDLNGNGIQTTGVEQGALFDIDADGRLDQVSFVSGGDAFLALDRNHNGRIDDGSELFGDQHGDANGFEALAQYDDNNDGRIDAQDRVFQQLRLFSLNEHGQQEQSSLNDAGIRSLSLAYRDVNQPLNATDSLAQVSSYERNNGEQGLSGDLLLGFHTKA